MSHAVVWMGGVTCGAAAAPLLASHNDLGFLQRRGGTSSRISRVSRSYDGGGTTLRLSVV